MSVLGNDAENGPIGTDNKATGTRVGEDGTAMLLNVIDKRRKERRDTPFGVSQSIVDRRTAVRHAHLLHGGMQDIQIKRQDLATIRLYERAAEPAGVQTTLGILVEIRPVVVAPAMQHARGIDGAASHVAGDLEHQHGEALFHSRAGRREATRPASHHNQIDVIGPLGRLISDHGDRSSRIVRRSGDGHANGPERRSHDSVTPIDSNYSHAADELHISRQALRQAIACLESELGEMLFGSSKNNLRATAAAHYLYRNSRRAVEEFDLLERRALRTTSTV